MSKMKQIKFSEQGVPFAELESPVKRQNYGTVIKKSNPFTKIRGQIADQPIGFLLTEVCETLGVPIPPEIDLYERFNLWLIPQRVSVSKDGGITEPVSVGIEVEYRNDDPAVDLNRRMTCCVVNMLPGSEFIRLGYLKGNLSGSFSPSGEFKVSTKDLPLEPYLPLTANLRAGTTSALEFGIGINLSVTVPLISAVGVGDSRAEWVFNEESTNLYGKDIETWTVLAVPKEMSEIKHRLRLYLILRTAFFSTRHYSDWQTLTCVRGSVPKYKSGR